MPRLPRLTGKELMKCLKGHGFLLVRVHGSHHVMQHPDGRQTVVPVHAGETIGPGLLRKILNQTELEPEDLV
jgi:predicted RNA binding protein YcfA (HicA-like mRNA interferase family)